MKRIFRQIVHSIRKFFNKIIDKEAQRVFEFNNQILGTKPDDNTQTYYPPHHIGVVGTPPSAAGWFGVPPAAEGGERLRR